MGRAQYHIGLVILFVAAFAGLYLYKTYYIKPTPTPTPTLPPEQREFVDYAANFGLLQQNALQLYGIQVVQETPSLQLQQRYLMASVI